MLREATVLLALLTTGLAGCLGGEEPEPEALAPQDTPTPIGPQAVVALIDTGVNPYHVAFRDSSPLGWTHPSEYLPGFPADAPAIELTFDAEDLDAALEADSSAWEDVEEGQLYWIPGTKIVGAISFSAFADPPIFDTGHGTMTSSRAAGNEHSLCPACRIVMVQGFTGEAVTWASQQPWIDAQSNSWSPLVVLKQGDTVQEPGLREAFEAAASRHLVFGSAGNGVAGKLGLLGHPSFTRSTSGAAGVISVGGHDNGQVILWSGSVPHVATDACRNLAPEGDTLDGYGPFGGGTSSASPYAAGAAARIVLEARTVLADEGAGVVDGVLARGAPVGTGEGPLADGELSLDDAKVLLMKTALARPVASDHDGELCTTEVPYNTYPIAWSDIPDGTPAYYFVGYGGISVDSLAAALAVVRGEATLPDRSDADGWHELAEEARGVYDALP